MTMKQPTKKSCTRKQECTIYFSRDEFSDKVYWSTTRPELIGGVWVVEEPDRMRPVLETMQNVLTPPEINEMEMSEMRIEMTIMTFDCFGQAKRIK